MCEDQDRLKLIPRRQTHGNHWRCCVRSFGGTLGSRSKVCNTSMQIGHFRAKTLKFMWFYDQNLRSNTNKCFLLKSFSLENLKDVLKNILTFSIFTYNNSFSSRTKFLTNIDCYHYQGADKATQPPQPSFREILRISINRSSNSWMFIPCFMISYKWRVPKVCVNQTFN